jgi:Ca-activated chloride channel homolog
MRLRLLISLSCLLFLAGQRAGAQLAPADDFFHSGARYYISNSVPQAKDVVEQGLKLYPNDEKLKKLWELMNQQQQQQQQQQQNQQNQQQNQSQSQQQDSKDQQKQDQQKNQDQQKKDEEKKKEEQQKQQEQKRDQQQKDQDKDNKDKDADKDKDKAQQAQPVKAGEMTPEEAKRLLDAQKGNEQLLQLKPQDKPRDSSRPVRDW